MIVVFDNVEVKIEADSPREAYKLLDDMFSSRDCVIGYSSDTFSAGDQRDIDTAELWGDLDEE